LGVACVLREPAMEDPAIRLAYVHNLGDTLLSLAPVVAGVFILVSGRPIFDLLVALLIAAFIIVTTIRSVVVSHKELLWPDNIACGHQDKRGERAPRSSRSPWRAWPVSSAGATQNQFLGEVWVNERG
jgi:Co/Zn/Cd efflux system component